MKKIILAVATVLSLPVFYVVGPLFLPTFVVARVYYPADIKARYLARHVNESVFQEIFQ